LKRLTLQNSQVRKNYGPFYADSFINESVATVGSVTFVNHAQSFEPSAFRLGA
jgi:hypothetical protein